MTGLRKLPNVGRTARAEGWEEIGVSTLDRISEALCEGDREGALELFDYHVERECESVTFIYYRWLPDVVRWIAERVDAGSLAPVLERSFAGWLPTERSQAAARQLAEVFAHGMPAPDAAAALVDGVLGRPGWREGGAAAVAGSARAAVTDPSAPAAEAVAAVRALTLDFRSAHDLLTDWTWGLLTAVQEVLGEDAVEQVITETVQGPLIEGRTSFDALRTYTPEEIVQLSVETMRGHFSGPRHLGDVEVTEEPDRYVLSFSPCGSGGRMRRGDDTTGTGRRTEPPYRFGVTTRAHAWSWGEKGVCLYCAHCSIVNEILPMKALGYPKRVTEYPREEGQPCRWLVYKAPELVPEECYERVGEVKPERYRGGAAGVEERGETEEGV